MDNKLVKLAAVTLCIALLLVTPIYAGLIINKDSDSSSSPWLKSRIIGSQDVEKNNESLEGNTVQEGSNLAGEKKTIPEGHNTVQDSSKSGSTLTSSGNEISPTSSLSITLYSPDDGATSGSTTNTHEFSISDTENDQAGCWLYYDDGSGDTEMWDSTVFSDNHHITVDITASEGVYDWHVECTSGNLVSSSHRQLTIDNTPPGSVSNLHETTVTPSSIRWEWTDPSDSGLDHIEVYLDGNFVENVSEGTEYVDATGLNPNTDYTITVYPVDEAGNVGSSTSDSATTDPDTTDPVVSYNPNTDDSGSYAKDWVFVNVTIDDSHLQSYEFRWDGGVESFDNVDSENNWYWENKTGLPEGTYNFSVYAVDTSGNDAETAERSVSLDTNAPSSVTNLHETNATSSSITWEWTDPSDSDLDHVEVYLNNTFLQNVSPGTEYFEATGLSAEELYELGVRPVDSAGNIGPWTNDTAETLEVDSLPAFDFVEVSPSSPNENDDLTCEFQFQDQEDSSLSADVTWYRNGARDSSWDNSMTAQNNTLETSAGPTSSDTSAGEDWNCEVTLDDRDGDVSQNSSVVTISQIVNNPPGVYLVTPDNEYTNDVTPDIEYYFIDNENDTADATLTFDGATSTDYDVQNGSSPHKFISPSPQSEGSHYYNITVDDGEYTTTSATQVITIDITDPTISYVDHTDASGSYDKHWISVNVTASDDLSLNSVTLEWNGVNETFDGSSGSNYWENKTGLSYGTYTFKAYAEDEAGNIVSTSERTITLEAAHSLPTFDFVRVNPANPETDDDLVCEFQYSDAENSSLEADIKWYRDGSWISTWDNSITAQNNTLETSAGPTSGQTSNGQTYECEVTLHDIDGDVTNKSDPATVADYTGPGAVTSLDETSTGEDWIYWEWTNPSDSDFDHSEVSINGSAPVSVGTDERFNATGLNPDTLYEINVTTYDTSGNEGDSAQDLATTDAVNTAPTIILVSPDDGNKTSDNTTRHYFNVTDSEQSTLMCTLHYSTLGEVDERSVSNNTVEYAVPSSGVADGTYDWWIECNDTENVVSSSTRTIEIDTTPPDNASDIGLPVGTTWIKWHWNDPANPDLDHIEVYTDNLTTAVTTVSPGTEEYNATGFSPSTSHTIGLVTVDDVGNKGNMVTDTQTTLQAPNSNPVIQTVDVKPDSPGSDENLSCEFRATDDENTTLYADVTWYRDGTNMNSWDVSGMAITNDTLETAPSAPAYTDTATGEDWTCEVTVSDDLGATDEMNGSETIQSAVGPGGNTLPTVHVTTANNTIVTTSTPTIDFYFTDPEDARGDATLYFNGTNVGSLSDVGNNTPSSITASSLSDGLYDFRVDVSDGAGTNSSLTYKLRVDTAMQYVDLFYNNNTDEDGTYSKDWIMVNVTARDSNYTSVTLEWNGSNESFANENVSGNDWYWTNKTGLTEGTYTFRAYADRPSGTDMTEERIVTLDTTEPNITNVTTDPDNVTNDGNEQDINVSFNSSEYPLEITFNLYDSGNSLVDTQGPTTVNNSSELPITYTIPAGLSDGTYTLNMTTVDNAGNSVTVTVMTFAVSTSSSGPSGGGGGGAISPTGGITNATLTVTPPEEEESEGPTPNPGVGVESEFSGIVVEEGRTKTVTFTVENSGNIEDVYSITVEGPGWASVDKERVSLEPEESVQVLLTFSPENGDAGEYVIRTVADSQNKEASSTWDFDVKVVPAGAVSAFITFAGGRLGAALLGLAVLIFVSAVFWRSASLESRKRVKETFRPGSKEEVSEETKKKVSEEQEFLDSVVEKVEEEPKTTSATAAVETGASEELSRDTQMEMLEPKSKPEPETEFDFEQREDKYIWEV